MSSGTRRYRGGARGLRIVALGVPAAQAARFGYADGWLGRLLSAFAE